MCLAFSMKVQELVCYAVQVTCVIEMICIDIALRKEEVIMLGDMNVNFMPHQRCLKGF